MSEEQNKKEFAYGCVVVIILIILILLLAYSTTATSWEQYEDILTDYETYTREDMSKDLRNFQPYRFTYLKDTCKSLWNESVERTINNVLDYVENNIDYDWSNKWHHSAYTTYRLKLGVCEDTTDLTIALLRCNDIPARKAKALVLTDEWTYTDMHTLPEIALPVFDSYIVWIPIDQYGWYGRIRRIG